MKALLEKIRFVFLRFPFLKYILLFLLYFSMEYLLLSSQWFGSDELDIMIAGRDMADGYQLYTDYTSQHMPFSYYISAFFALLGARTVSLQRICFFIFYSLMWTLMVFLYGKDEKKRAVALYPILYIFVSCSYDFGTAILSEQIAGIGFCFLFLEFLQFYRTKELKARNYLVISWSVLLTFGTMFISAFGLFVIALAVLILEIYWEIRKKESFLSWFLRMLKRYLLLFFAIIVPWVIMLIYYAANNMLNLVVFSTYTYNTEIYSKYSGFGGSIGDALKMAFTSIFRNLKDDVNIIIAPENRMAFARALLFILLFILFVLFLVYAARKIGIFVSIVSFLLVVALSVRGVLFMNTFHAGTPIMVICLFAALFFGNVVFVRWEKRRGLSISLKVISLASIAFMALFYLRIANLTSPSHKQGDVAVADAIEAITDKGEVVWNNTFMLDLDMNSDRPMIWNIGVTPWGWEAFSDQIFPLIKENRPRVIVFDPGYHAWNMLLEDYAPELVDYVEDNYTNLSATYIVAYTLGTTPTISEDSVDSPSCVYILNDYYDEAIKKLSAGGDQR